jgi:hypothetical protein
MVFVAVTASPIPVYAQTSAPTDTVTPGAAALKRAHDAWGNGDFDLAPGLYRTALETGGLPRAGVVEAYVRIGAALAVAGKKKPALAAFRDAALLDPSFEVPAEAGKKAAALAERARREQARAGPLRVTTQVVDEVDAGAPFTVVVSVAPDHAPLVDSVTLEARDALSGRAFAHQEPPGARVRFEVPTRMTLPDATLVLRAQARDAHANELVTVERRVHVAHAPVVAAVTPLTPLARPRSEDRPAHASSGGFWSSPWPYVLGGAALAAGGAAVWFATRPPDDVTVGAARVQLVP